MLKHLKEHQILFTIIPSSIFLAIFLFLPSFVQTGSIVTALVSIGAAVVIVSQKHRLSSNQTECPREKMIRNLAFDLLGLLLTMAAAIYLGRLAGAYIGLRAGYWLGLLAGFVGGFAAAWLVRSAWGRFIRTPA